MKERASQVASLAALLTMVSCGPDDDSRIIRESGSDLHGTVYDASTMKPIPDVFVIGQSREDRATARTDREGGFWFETEIGDVRSELLFAKRGYVSAVRVPSDMEYSGEGHYELTVRLERGVSDLPILRGVVVDSASALGLEDVEVSYSKESVLSDSVGRYEIPYLGADRAFISVWFEKSGYDLLIAREDAIAQLNEVDFELNAQMTIRPDLSSGTFLAEWTGSWCSESLCLTLIRVTHDRNGHRKVFISGDVEGTFDITPEELTLAIGTVSRAIASRGSARAGCSSEEAPEYLITFSGDNGQGAEIQGCTTEEIETARATLRSIALRHLR